MSEKVWFITGTSRGFGREWTIAALERGDKVAATARNTDSLADLVDKYGEAILPIALDVTEMPRSCSIAIQSDVACRSARRDLTEPARWIAPPYSRSFSVSVVFPASGWLMMPKVRR